MLERLSMCKYHVGREIPHFAKVNVNKFDIFLRNCINSTCMLSLSMYAFIVHTMRLSAKDVVTTFHANSVHGNRHTLYVGKTCHA